MNLRIRPLKTMEETKGEKNCIQRKWVKVCLLPYFISKPQCIIFPLTMLPPPLNTSENKKCQLWVVETQFRINDDRRVICSKDTQLVQRIEGNTKEIGLLQRPERQERVSAPPRDPLPPLPPLASAWSPHLHWKAFSKWQRVWGKAAWNPSFQLPNTSIRGPFRFWHRLSQGIIVVSLVCTIFPPMSNLREEGGEGSLVITGSHDLPICQQGWKFVTRDTGRWVLVANYSCCTRKHIIP